MNYYEAYKWYSNLFESVQINNIKERSGRTIPGPTNTKYLVGSNRWYDLYRVTDVEDAINIAIDPLKSEKAFGYWDICGRSAGIEDQIDLSQAEKSFNNSINNGFYIYFGIPKDGDSSKKYVLTIMPRDDDLIIDDDNDEDYLEDDDEDDDVTYDWSQIDNVQVIDGGPWTYGELRRYANFVRVGKEPLPNFDVTWTDADGCTVQGRDDALEDVPDFREGRINFKHNWWMFDPYTRVITPEDVYIDEEWLDTATWLQKDIMEAKPFGDFIKRVNGNSNVFWIRYESPDGHGGLLTISRDGKNFSTDFHNGDTQKFFSKTREQAEDAILSFLEEESHFKDLSDVFYTCTQKIIDESQSSHLHLDNWLPKNCRELTKHCSDNDCVSFCVDYRANYYPNCHNKDETYDAKYIGYARLQLITTDPDNIGRSSEYLFDAKIEDTVWKVVISSPTDLEILLNDVKKEIYKCPTFMQNLRVKLARWWNYDDWNHRYVLTSETIHRNGGEYVIRPSHYGSRQWTIR